MNASMPAHLIENIPYAPDLPALMKRLRVREGSRNAVEFSSLVGQAAALARPKAIYVEAYIESRGEDWVEIGERRFSSRVLRVNLEQAHRVFPFLATCGEELQEWSTGITDTVARYWAEAIKEDALFTASRALEDHIHDHYRPGHIAMMNPGSLPDWPLDEQLVLFDLFGSSSAQIGVQLTENLIMQPIKSVSGIHFPTEVDFESCQLCQREACPGRRAPYNPDLYEARYSLHNG